MVLIKPLNESREYVCIYRLLVCADGTRCWLALTGIYILMKGTAKCVLCLAGTTSLFSPGSCGYKTLKPIKQTPVSSTRVIVFVPCRLDACISYRTCMVASHSGAAKHFVWLHGFISER